MTELEQQYAVMLKARITTSRWRLWSRLVALVEAFERDDPSLYTPEQRSALKRATKLIDEVSK